jgi:GntR family transcriptional regulator, rspAB operon transcriptional repressor
VTTQSPNPRERLSDRAYAALRAMIREAKLPPGSRLSDAALVEHIGVGRTPLREALLRLADEGLVEVYPQSGSFVAPIRLQAVSEGQFVREHLECAVIRDLAVRIDEAGCVALKEIIAKQEAASAAADADRFFALDEALHGQFAALAGRAGVWRVIQQSKIELDRVRVLSLPMSEQTPRLIEQHHAIVEAVAARDHGLAEARLRIHLREVFATIDRLGLDRLTAEPSPAIQPVQTSPPARHRRPSRTALPITVTD